MPREFSEHRERWIPRENRERDETLEKEERSERIREVLDGVFRELEHKESVEKIVRESIEELEEVESQAERVENIAREASEELRSIEEELDERLEDVREELHEDFVNDMECQLESPSLNDSKDESSESDHDGETSETAESSQSYIEGGDGTVYVVETGGPSEAQARNEIETETEEVAEEEHQDSPQVSEGTIEEAEPEKSAKVRNSITRPEHAEVEESEETVVPAEATEGRAKSPSEEEVGLEDRTEESESEHKQRRANVPSEVEETLSPASEDALEEVTEPAEEPAPETMESVPEEGEVAVEQGAGEVEETPESSIEIESEESGEVSDVGEAGEELVEVPEEIIRKVEDLLEELDAPEEEEVDESRVITDAMTGERHIDHSLEPRPYFSETEEDRGREEEERIRERLREFFARLTEEERERFKESVRREVGSEEELEALVKRWRSRVVSPDFRQNLEDARQYVRSKKGEVPRLIRELQALEVERAWASAVGEAVRRSVDRSLVSVVRSQTGRQHQNVKKRRKTGYHKVREHPIRLHQPMCGKRPAGSFESYRKWLERDYPGVCVRSDYPALLEQLRRFFELRAALKERKAIRQFELDAIAERIGLKKGTAQDWVFRGQSPHLFKIVASSMSARGARRLLNEIVKRAGGIRSWSELELWLKLLYPDGAYKRIAQYRSKEARVREFFAFLGELERGGAQKDIARRSGISKRRVRAFTAGEVPWLIRHVLAQTGRLRPTERYRYHLGSTYRVKTRLPVVRGKEVRSYDEFVRLVHRDFPWLKERSDYERLMRVARAYFDALEKFSGQSHVTRNEIVEFVNSRDISVLAVIQWFNGKSLPMVFDMIDRALSTDEALKELEDVIRKLDGVVNIEAYEKRMKTLYVLNELKALPSYRKDYESVKEFFRFLEALRRGGLHTDIIQRGKLRIGNTNRRLARFFPRLINIATSIPKTKPKPGYKWVPLKVVHGVPRDYIEVPLAIKKASELYVVLERLLPLKGRRMMNWRVRFGELLRTIAFMYLLGALASDGTFGRRNGISTPVSMDLSTKYPWSEAFGEAFCYCLGIFGFRANRLKNSPGKNKKDKSIVTMNWKSTSSPFFLWIRESLLGLKRLTKKQDQSFRASWILRMPAELVLAFIQGIADGDGFASPRSLRVGIATKHNRRFFSQLLSLLGIESTFYGNGIVISKKDALKVASKLPIFRYAHGRLNRLHGVVEMLERIRRSRLSPAELRSIMELHFQGLKPGEILTTLWAEQGFVRRPETIQKAIKRELERRSRLKTED